MSEYDDIKQKILCFRDQRNWRQFHDPKNLASGLAIEAAELLEVFLWKTTEESRKLRRQELEHLRHEMADIFVFLVYLCEEFNIDLFAAVRRKISLNRRKYPVKKARDSRTKYTEFLNEGLKDAKKTIRKKTGRQRR